MMNTFNRVMMVLLLIVLIALATTVLVAPHLILPAVGQWMVDGGKRLGDPTAMNQWLRLGVGIVIAFAVNLVLFILLFLELRPSRPRHVQVQQVNGGLATVSLTSIAEQIQYKLDPLPGVIKVSPKVRARGKKVEAKVDVAIAREAQVAQMAETLIGIVQSVLTQDMGLQIAGKPEVRMQLVTAKGGAVIKAPEAPVTETPPPVPVVEPAVTAPAPTPVAQTPPPLPIPSPGESTESKGS